MTRYLRLFFFFFLICQFDVCAQKILESDTVQLKKLIREFSRRYNDKSSRLYNLTTGEIIERSRGISQSTFDTLFKPIYGKVMLGNNDLISQGSAYALTVDQFESKFNINYNWLKNRKKIGGAYFNAGLAASSSSKLLPVFSKDEWQQGLSMSFGVTKSFKNSISYTRPHNLDSIRRSAIMLSIKDTYTFLSKDTTRYDTLSTLLGKISDKEFKSIDSIYNKISKIKYKGTNDVEADRLDIAKAASIRSLDSSGITRYVDSCIVSFEKKRFKTYYSFWWYNLAVRPEYKSIAIYDTAVASLVGIKKKDFLGLNFDISINRAKIAKSYLLLIQFGLNLKNTNYLEGKKASDLQLSTLPTQPVLTVVNNEQAVVLGNYDTYKNQFLLLTPSFLCNGFIGPKRQFGWEVLGSTKLGVRSSSNPYNDLYTIRTGPLFSFNGKDDLSKSTFGLLIEWKDVTYKNSVPKESFTFNVRIGIPFNF